MAHLTKAQIKGIADRAQARSDGARDDDDAEWERGFDQTCEKARHERSREIIEAEIERLARLTTIDYEIERKAAVDRLKMRPAALDALVKTRRPKKTKKPAAPEIDPDELQRAASHIIKHPDILNLFAKEFSKVIAGETVNGKLLYLVATSRLFDKPMSAAIKGTSAGGKSEIRKRVLEFFPPEDVVTFTSLSEKSLIYYDGDFAHKILSVGEAAATDEQEFQNYLLRELISESVIRHSVVQKVGNDLQTIVIVKNGPVAFLVTTTKNALHAENETRLLSLEIDDSESQTKNVLDKVAQVHGLHTAAAVDDKPWQDYQRWLGLGECRVVVPFAPAMVELIPPVAVRLRRDVGQLIHAIQAHALLHRDQRDHDDAGQIIADIDNDYETVRKLMNAIIAESAGVAINPAIIETIDAVTTATIGMTEAEGANAKDIAKLLKLDRSATWRRLTGACTDGYVCNLEQRRGMPGKYRTTGQKAEPVAILPPASKLAEKYNTQSSLSHLPKPAQPCNREGIAETSQADIGCKLHLQPETTEQPVTPDGLHGCSRLQTALATDSPLDGNGKSPPVARLHEFPGDTPPENFPPVCVHCGGPATADAPVRLCTVEGEEHLLHRACQAEWLSETPDLSGETGEMFEDIPAGLDRRGEICAHCGQPWGGEPGDYDGVKVRLHPHCEKPWIDAYEAS